MSLTDETKTSGLRPVRLAFTEIANIVGPCCLKTD